MHARTKLLHGISGAGGGQAVATGRGYGLKGDGGWRSCPGEGGVQSLP